MNTRRITKKIGKQLILAISSDMVIGVISWLGDRRDRKKKAAAEARKKAHK
jgi:hypothetical protein